MLTRLIDNSIITYYLVIKERKKKMTELEQLIEKCKKLNKENLHIILQTALSLIAQQEQEEPANVQEKV